MAEIGSIILLAQRLGMNNVLSCQTEFDHFYSIAHSLLDHFYPERTVTMTSTPVETQLT